MAVKTLDATNGVHQETLPPSQITGERATYKAKGYLAAYVSACYGASDPVLVQLDRLVWQVLIHFKAPHEKPLRVGLLNIDAETGEVYPLTDDEIDAIRGQASAFVRANPSPAKVQG